MYIDLGMNTVCMSVYVHMYVYRCICVYIYLFIHLLYIETSNFLFPLEEII